MSTTNETEYEIALKQNSTGLWLSIPPLEFTLLDQLQDIGISVPTELRPAALAAINKALDQAGEYRGAEAMNHIAGKLDGTAAGVALRRVITGSDEPIRDAAHRAGVSHPCLLKHEKKIRKRLGVTKPNHCRKAHNSRAQK